MKEQVTSIELPGVEEQYITGVKHNIRLEHVHRYLMIRELVRDKDVLDIASGEGYGPALLAEMAKSVVGMDISRQAVTHAQRKYRRNNLQFQIGSHEAISLSPQSIDVVVSFTPLEHYDQHQAMLGEVKRVLRSDGLLIILSSGQYEASAISSCNHPYHVKGSYQHEVEKILFSYFSNVVFYSQPIIHEATTFSNQGSSDIHSYEHQNNRLAEVSNIPHPIHLIAVASNGKIPQMVSGIFEKPITESEVAFFLLTERHTAVAERDAQIESNRWQLMIKEGQIHEKEGQIHEKEGRIEQLEARIDELKAQIAGIYNSTSWRITAPIRLVKYPGQWIREVYRTIPLSIETRFKIRKIIFTAFRPFLKKTASYQAWLALEQSQAAKASDSVLPTKKLTVSTKKIGPQSSKLLSKEEGSLSDSYAEYYALYQHKLKVASVKETEDYVPIDETGVEISTEGVKLIAFYLPQFHPIPLNDITWGKGFTEWANVSKAVPQFLGHYQPHLPGELGFYDLRVPAVLQRQVELAKLYSIYGFCFHFYWFAGTRLLERPLNQFLAATELDFPFCICWANENWTRRWDGQGSEILIAQKHSPEQDLAFIEDIAPILANKRYIRIDGKPLLIVYRPQLLPDTAATAERWREHCKQVCLPGIYLIAAQTFGLIDPRPYGFDAAVEFPPHGSATAEMTEEITLLNRGYKGHVFDYHNLILNKRLAYKGEPYPVFRCIFPGWDNEARRPGAGHVYFHSEPRLYARWLNTACAYAHASTKNSEERLVFINAWNEWAEGAHLEPDRRYGYAYLDATKKVVQHFASYLSHPRIAIILHLFYPKLWPEIRSYLYNIPEPFDLFITATPTLPAEFKEQIFCDFPNVKLKIFENHGRDILPFYRLLENKVLCNYKWVCKIHSKKSVHGEYGEIWRQELLDRLLGSPESILNLIGLFESNEKIAIIGPENHVLQSTYYWGLRNFAIMNKQHIQWLVERANLGIYDDHFYFVAGSMFWFRPKALGSLGELKLEDENFEPEQGQIDGTLAHGFERFLGLYLRQQGYLIADTNGDFYEEVSCTDKPEDPLTVWSSFAHPTYEGEPL